MTKFHRDGSGLGKIRSEVLTSGKVIAFGIAGTTLTVMQFGEGIDFDNESDELLTKHRDSKVNMAFEYFPNIGFEEVNVAEQSWFDFKRA
jgi:hypothetical protein